MTAQLLIIKLFFLTSIHLFLLFYSNFGVNRSVLLCSITRKYSHAQNNFKNNIKEWQRKCLKIITKL